MADNQLECSGQLSRAGMRRRRILESARKLFVERGFHATGVAQIARESGVAVGQMYRDFASKEDIVAALVAEDCAAFLRAEMLASAISDGDSGSAMTWLLALLEPSDDPGTAGLFAEIVAESARNKRIAAIFASLQLELRSTVMEALAQIAPDPKLDDARSLLADTLLTLSLGLLHNQLLNPAADTRLLSKTMQQILKERVIAMATAGQKEVAA